MSDRLRLDPLNPDDPKNLPPVEPPDCPGECKRSPDVTIGPALVTAGKFPKMVRLADTVERTGGAVGPQDAETPHGTTRYYFFYCEHCKTTVQTKHPERVMPIYGERQRSRIWWSQK